VLSPIKVARNKTACRLCGASGSLRIDRGMYALTLECECHEATFYIYPEAPEYMFRLMEMVKL